MPLRIPTLALILCAGTLVGQAPDAPAVDVHVLQIITQPGEIVPKAEIVAAKRIIASASEEDREVSVRVGGKRVRAEILPAGESPPRYQREIGRSTMISDPPRRVMLDVTEQFRWSRRPRHGEHARAAILSEPVTDPARPFAALDVSGFMRRLYELLMEPESVSLLGRFQLPPQLRGDRRIQHLPFGWGTPRWRAALVLGSVPLDSYLTDSQIDRILDAASKLPQHIEDQAWPFLRPLIVLGDRATLAALARRSDERSDEGRDAGDGDEVALTPRVPRAIEDSVLVAYAIEADPEIRGLAGWIATGTRSPDLLDMLEKDVRSGRAILPGDAARRARLEQHIVELRAWQAITAPALTLVGGALAIAGVLLLVRIVVRRML